MVIGSKLQEIGTLCKYVEYINENLIIVLSFLCNHNNIIEARITLISQFQLNKNCVNPCNPCLNKNQQEVLNSSLYIR